MEVQMRQFEQMQQILGTNMVPVGLLRMVERGNKYRKPIFGGWYMNGKDLVDLCLMWEMADKMSDTVSSLMEYKNYSPPKMEKPKMDKPKREMLVRKKKVAING